MPSIRIEADEQTEALAQFILGEIDDETLDSIGVDREALPSKGLICEPTTTALILTVSGTTAVLIARIVERWLESRRQAQSLRLVLEGFQASEAAGRAMARVVETHATVSIRYALPPDGE